MTAALPSSTGASHVHRGRVVQDTDRAVLFFEPDMGTVTFGRAAWIPLSVIARQVHDGKFGAEAPMEISLRAAPAVDWQPARLVGSNQIRWLPRPRLAPEPVMPQIGKRPASPVALPGETAFRRALEAATVERTSPGGATLEELLARFPKGVLLTSGPEGCQAAAVVERNETGVRTTPAVLGASVLEALESLDAQRAEHERARREHRSRVTGGGRR